jgi:RHS repeat-associated protein
VLRIVKEDGTVVNQYDYDAFGRVRQASPNTFATVENRYLFQGREWDKNGGFYYFRNRIYLPERGEFATPDMNLGRGILGELDGMATLTFCGGDPVNMVDPTGLQANVPRVEVGRERGPRLALPVPGGSSFREFAALMRGIKAERELEALYRDLNTLPLYEVARMRKEWENNPPPRTIPSSISATGAEGENTRVKTYEDYTGRVSQFTGIVRQQIQRVTNPRAAAQNDELADQLNALLRNLGPSKPQPETVSPKTLQPKTVAPVPRPGINSTPSSAGVGGAVERGALVKYEPWPKAPNSPHVDGFLFGVRQVETMLQGQILSRLGETSGRYVSPPGTSLSARGLPAGYQGSETLWQVVKPFQAESGLSAPWQGSSGIGIQHRLPQSIDALKESGYLKPVRQ